MRLTKEQRLDMVQLGYNPLLDADIERFFAGQAPTMHRSQLYEGENHSLGQSHFTERDMGNVPEYSSMKIGQITQLQSLYMNLLPGVLLKIK